MKIRNSVVFYVNQVRHEINDHRVFMPLSTFLRYELSLTGTKVVCAEGDCGACTVLMASSHEIKKNKFQFKSVNACILPLFSLDACLVLTVESLQSKDKLHPVQNALLKCFGSQCGYCTPGFVCSMASLVEDCLLEKKPITEKKTKNYLTGNLCRCTGYAPIIKAALSIDLKTTESLQNRFHDIEVLKELTKLSNSPVKIVSNLLTLFLPTTMKQALTLKAKFKNIQIVAGATDLGVSINKGKNTYSCVMSLQNIKSLWQSNSTQKALIVNARVTLSEFKKMLLQISPEMKNMLDLFASLQIKNTGTLVGNVVNASPISDTIPFLMALDSQVELQSLQNGIVKKRFIPISKFYLGYKKLNLSSKEIVVAIHISNKFAHSFLRLYKVSLRKDLDISAVTMALRLDLTKKDKKIEHARVVFGGVGPTVKRIDEIESLLLNNTLTPDLFLIAAKYIEKYVQPLSDVRGSKEYRLKLCENLLKKVAFEIEKSQ